MQPMSTNELRVAEKISLLVNDVTLDLEQLGIYLASNSPVTFGRLMEIFDAAKLERQAKGLSEND